MNKYVIILVMLLALVGCSKKPYQANLSASNEQKQSTAIIRNEAKTIESVAPEVKPHTESIVVETQKIDKSSDKLEKIVIALQAEIKELKNQNKQWYNKFLYTLIIASGLSVAVSIALFFLGNIKSLTLTIISLSVLLGSIALVVLAEYFIYIAIAAVILIVGLIIYAVKRNNKNITQIVKSVQIGKNEGVVGEQFNAIANEKQDKVTQNLVAKVKKKIAKDIQREQPSGAGQ